MWPDARLATGREVRDVGCRRVRRITGTDPLGEVGARPWALRPELNSLEHMRDAVFFDGPEVNTRLSRFWLLLVLSSVIAAAGVVAELDRDVIGAMIVAPLMLPIQGTMLATVLADRRNFTRSFLILIAGAASAVAVGFLVGLLAITPIVAATNEPGRAAGEPAPDRSARRARGRGGRLDRPHPQGHLRHLARGRDRDLARAPARPSSG